MLGGRTKIPQVVWEKKLRFFSFLLQNDSVVLESLHASCVKEFMIHVVGQAYKWHPSLLSTFSCQSYHGPHLISREVWKIQSFFVSRSMK